MSKPKKRYTWGNYERGLDSFANASRGFRNGRRARQSKSTRRGAEETAEDIRETGEDNTKLFKKQNPNLKRRRRRKK